MLVNVLLTECSIGLFYFFTVRLKQVVEIILVKRHQRVKLAHFFFSLAASSLNVDNSISFDKDNAPVIIPYDLFYIFLCIGLCNLFYHNFFDFVNEKRRIQLYKFPMDSAEYFAVGHAKWRSMPTLQCRT